MNVFHDDQKGERTWWYNDGHLWSQEIKSNNSSMIYKSWHTNGNIQTSKFYLDGKINGEFKTWNPNGDLVAHKFYRDGKLVAFLTHTRKMFILKYKAKLRAKVKARFMNAFKTVIIPDLSGIVVQYLFG